ncbi:MAG: type 4 fimbriae expression regulatory protein PilR [Porticoccaceae bacterium]|nr:MAG: type 4 fimbriae expression regulatory protein PilR [Porticoccaceae bacterium]
MVAPRVLIVDDEPDIRELLALTLEGLDLEVASAASVAEARRQLDAGRVDFCLTDMRLPDGDGFAVLAAVQQRQPNTPVAVITAYGSAETAVEALKRGAFDFVCKPLEVARLRELVSAALQLREGAGGTRSAGLIGDSEPMQRLREQIAKVARSQAPVFIGGESGSGKELVARAIHYEGPRARGPFIAVNCGAIPTELVESELFGHRRGSFSGAVQDKPGLFQAARGGTLFLDEVAELPPAMQVKLLRAIQEKRVRPIGATEEVAVDVRILSASHKDLAAEVRAGRFREDLYYRINVIELRVPPLRERREDIPRLAAAFLERFARQAGRPVPRLDEAALAALLEHSFPGNVRELENILERAFTLAAGEVIGIADLELRTPPPAPADRVGPRAAGDYPADGSLSLDDYLADLEREIVLRALEENRWNRTATAARLGLSFRQLRYKLKKLGIQ